MVRSLSDFFPALTSGPEPKDRTRFIIAENVRDGILFDRSEEEQENENRPRRGRATSTPNRQCERKEEASKEADKDKTWHRSELK